jgi:hypothetical protein
MKKLIIILTLISIIILPIYSQTIENIYPVKTFTNIPLSNDTSYSYIALNTYFTYMFIENTSVKYTNAKGFGLDLQIDQNNYTSWLLGFNISFYKEYSNVGTFNLSTFNIIAGPKFYFSTAQLSMYARLNAGVTFSKHAEGSPRFYVSFFPALGIEQNINNNFKLFIESTANANIDLMGTTGHFSVNIGLISSF